MQQLRRPLGVCAALLLCGAVQAQPYPSKPVRIVVGFTPGGAVDVTARVLAERLAPALGQQVLVDNRAGSSGNIAAELVAKAPPDGYTLHLGTYIMATSPSLFRKLAYDPVRDFAPISLNIVTPSVLIVHPSLPARDVKQFVQLAKTHPGKLNYSSAGVGAASHLCGEIFNQMAGIRTNHVPYKGAVQAATDLIGGHIEFTFSTILVAIPHVKSGRLRALGVTSAGRNTQMPEVPTMAESGYPDFVWNAWWGMFAPAGTPPAVVTRLNAEIIKALDRKDAREILTLQGMDVETSTPAELGERLKRDIGLYAELIKRAGIQPE